MLVQADTTVTVPLKPAPVPVDSLLVDLRSIDVSARVRDRERDAPLTDAEVLVNQEPATVSNPDGRLRLDDLWEGVPVLVSIRAFGYLPSDTVVTPAEDDSYVFELSPDPVVERMIAAQVSELQQRMGGRRSILMPPVDRDRLLGWTGVSLREVLAGTYPTRWRRIRCVLVDEVLVPPGYEMDMMESTFPGEVERLEFLFRGRMLRVYTRGFLRDMIAGLVELRTPVYVDEAKPPLCR